MAETAPLWEYQVAEFGGVFKREPSPESMQECLNEWGAQGWELVSVVYAENSTRWRLVAKRPLTASARRMRSRPGG